MGDPKRPVKITHVIEKTSPALPKHDDHAGGFDFGNFLLAVGGFITGVYAILKCALYFKSKTVGQVDQELETFNYRGDQHFDQPMDRMTIT